jgi:hypothetical protein
MGDKAMSQLGLWKVFVREIDPTGRRALVSWNGNAAEWWHDHRLRRLYVTPPKAYRDQQERKARYA